MTPEPLAYRENRFIPQSQAGLSLHDDGFVQGVTITDRVRTFHREPFRLMDHLARFRQSCHLARVPLEVGEEHLENVARKLIRWNGRLLESTQDLSLILFATPGAGEGHPTLGMYTTPLPLARYRHLMTKGATLLYPKVRHVAPGSIDRRIKHRSRLFWWLAEQEVRDRDPLANALLLDADGTITETSAANFLLVCQGTVLSPPTWQVLGGISLAVVREMCDLLGIPFVRRPLWPEDCHAAEEALLTCTSYSLAPVARIEERTFPVERPIFERLLTEWNRRVGLDLRAQILGH